MPPGGTTTAVAPNAGSSPATTKNAPPPMLQPFVAGAREHVEGAFSDVSTQIGASGVQVGPVSVPAYGYLRSIVLLVSASGGVNGSTTVAVTGDAPWNCLQNVQLTDVNGAPIVGPFSSGYALYLINKYGGYSWSADPNLSPNFTTVSVGGSGTGNFAFLIRIPVEICQRDSLGSLPNQNAASTYKIMYTVAPSSVVYSTAPGTIPILRVRMFLEAWSQPNATDARGMPQAQTPPALGTTQYWSEIQPVVTNGQQTVQLTRVGNLIRMLLFVSRDSSGNRLASNGLPDPITLQWDTRIIQQKALGLFKEDIFDYYGYGLGDSSLDNGVIFWHFAHDFSGKAGDELRNQYLPTTQATRLEIVGSFGSSSNTLECITNDVAPTGDIQVH